MVDAGWTGCRRALRPSPPNAPIAHRPSPIAHQPSTINHQPSTIAHRPPCAGRCFCHNVGSRRDAFLPVVVDDHALFERSRTQPALLGLLLLTLFTVPFG